MIVSSPKNYKSTTIRAYDVISDVYKKENYEPDFWLNEFKILLRLMKRNGAKVKESRFLDLGCGTGRDAHLAINTGMKYVGVDLSKGMLSVARRRVKRANFLEMDATELRLEDSEFDVLWAAAILLHFNSYDLRKALKEIGRVLKPGSFAFISVQKRQKGDKVKLMKKSVKDRKTVRRYFALYTKREFKRILERAGFNVIKATSKIEPEGEKEWLCFFVKNRKRNKS